MHQIAYVPSAGDAKLLPADDPGDPAPDEVMVRTIRVGFCGTDREIIQGHIAVLPEGAESLVLGHEMVAQVVSVGAEAAGVVPGQLVVPTVRRPCGKCAPCDRGRSDFCLTGEYLEYGITRLDGFARPAIALPAHMVVPVEDSLVTMAVLAEPLSIVEKALEQARYVLMRIPGLLGDEPLWGTGHSALVAGAGPIGLLSTYLLTQQGFEVEVIDVRPPDGLAPSLVAAAGATYAQVRRDRPDLAAAERRPAQLVIEATGDPVLAFELLRTLRPGGVLVWIGVGDPKCRAAIDAGSSVLRAVLGHQAVVATINSARVHFEQAVSDLALLAERPRFSEMITAVVPPENFAEAIWPTGDAIKQVVAFSDPL